MKKVLEGSSNLGELMIWSRGGGMVDMCQLYNISIFRHIVSKTRIWMQSLRKIGAISIEVSSSRNTSHHMVHFDYMSLEDHMPISSHIMQVAYIHHYILLFHSKSSPY